MQCASTKTGKHMKTETVDVSHHFNLYLYTYKATIVQKHIHTLLFFPLCVERRKSYPPSTSQTSSAPKWKSEVKHPTAWNRTPCLV